MPLICDFCSSPNVTWTFRASGSTTLITTTSGALVSTDHGDGWAACDICAGAICRNDRAALLGRSVRKFYEYNPDFRDVLIETLSPILRAQHDRFFATKLDNGRREVRRAD